MKIVKATVAFFYFSTQLFSVQSGILQIQNNPNINSLSKISQTSADALTAPVPSVNSASQKEIKMFYIAGKFAGSSLEVDGVAYKISLDEEGKGLLIRCQIDEERDWVVGQGSVSEEGDRVALTLSFNSGSTFFATYNRATGEMAISQRTENWVGDKVETGASSYKKEDVTHTFLYNKEGWLQDKATHGETSQVDESGNITLGIFQYHIAYGYSLNGKLLNAVEHKTDVTYKDEDSSLVRTESSQKYSFVNGEAKAAGGAKESRKEIPAGESNGQETIPLHLGMSASETLGSVIEEGARVARRLGLSASIKGSNGEVVLGLAALPKNFVDTIERIAGGSPKDGLIQYIYNSGGTNGNSSQMMGAS